MMVAVSNSSSGLTPSSVTRTTRVYVSFTSWFSRSRRTTIWPLHALMEKACEAPSSPLSIWNVSD